MRATRGRAWQNWGLPGEGGAAGPYEDLDAFLHGRAGELARSLLDQGITGMKMWPFDEAAYRNGGLHITAEELDQALEPFRQARRAVGKRMDLMVELHGLWTLPVALRIAHAFEAEGLSPYWIEDPLRPDDLASLAAFARGTRIPTTASEMLGGRQAFRELLEARAASIVMLDLGWCGGLTEGKAIAAMAEAFGLPVAPHDCTGPVVWTASVHLSLNAPNALIQETVARLLHGLVQRAGDGPAPGGQRPGAARDRCARPRCRPPARPRRPAGCHRASHVGRLTATGHVESARDHQATRPTATLLLSECTQRHPVALGAQRGGSR